MPNNEIKKIFKENIDVLDRKELRDILRDLKALNKICNKYDSYCQNRWDSYSQMFSNGKSLAKRLVDDIFDKYPYLDTKLNEEITNMMKKIKYYANTDTWQRLWDILKIL